MIDIVELGSKKIQRVEIEKNNMSSWSQLTPSRATICDKKVDIN